MHSRARISDHPIHPMLVGFPIVYYTSTVVALIAHAASGDPFWFRVALTTSIAGVVMAAIAAIPGLIDLVSVVPVRSRARATGILHMSFNVSALALFAVSAVILWTRWYTPDGELLDGTAPMAFAIAGLVATAIGGTLGWKLVQTHHVGIAPNTDLHRFAGRRDVRDGRPPAGAAIGHSPSQVRPSLH